jgi:hypothetical protein
MIQTITTYLAHDLLALSICSFIDGVQSETAVLIQAFLAAKLRGNTTFLASSHNCTKNKSNSSLSLIFIFFSFKRSIILKISTEKPDAGISLSDHNFVANVLYLYQDDIL